MPVWLVVVEWLARLILLALVMLSIWSVAIILDRRKKFKNLQIDRLLAELKAKVKGVSAQHFEKVIAPTIFNERMELEKGLSTLGTLGATAPFIGLLGTVLGIIVAFGELSQSSSDSNAIMFVLAEALVLTAMGLFVAIPAVIAFNYFSRRQGNYFAQVQSELEAYVALIEDK